jgi:hypothetical protein
MHESSLLMLVTVFCFSGCTAQRPSDMLAREVPDSIRTAPKKVQLMYDTLTSLARENSMGATRSHYVAVIAPAAEMSVFSGNSLPANPTASSSYQIFTAMSTINQADAAVVTSCVEKPGVPAFCDTVLLLWRDEQWISSDDYLREIEAGRRDNSAIRPRE